MLFRERLNASPRSWPRSTSRTEPTARPRRSWRWETSNVWDQAYCPIHWLPITERACLRLIQGRVRLIPELLHHLTAIVRRTASEPKLSGALAAYACNHSARAVTAGWQAPAAFWPRGALPKSVVTHSSMISAPSRLFPAHRSLDSGFAATSTFLPPPRVLRSHRRKQPAA